MKKNDYRTNKQRNAWNLRILQNRSFKNGNWDRHVEGLKNFLSKIKPYDKNQKD